MENPCNLQGMVKTGNLRFSRFPCSLQDVTLFLYMVCMPKFPALTSAGVAEENTPLTVLEQCHTFYVNLFIDKDMYKVFN
jgi:hypothetical protein